MSDFDDRLRQDLTKEDEAFLRDLEDGQGLFSQVTPLFRGPMAGITIIAQIVTLIVTGIGLYAVWKFIQAPEIRDMLLWGGAAWAAWTTQVALKQWAWDRMNHLGVLKELKKIELRLVQLERSRP